MSLTCCRKSHHTRNTHSSSCTVALLNRPANSRATLVDRPFSFASSSVWNTIPNDVRCAPLLSSLKSCLKTYLFRSVYKDWTFSLITVHHHYTRSANNISHPCFRLSSSQEHVLFSGQKIGNAMPAYLIEIKELNNFKHKFKLLLHSKYK